MANSPNSYENGELLRAPPSLKDADAPSSSSTMTEIAKSMLRSQLLYSSSIISTECLMPNHQSNQNNNTHNIIPDYPTLCDHKAPPHLSSHKQPSLQARLAITYLDPSNSDDAKGKKPVITSPSPNSNPEVQDIDDGRIRSLPCKKNGPYTCSKCMKVFPTSQHFAAHAAADHYKYETKEQSSRALKLQQVKDGGFTFVPVFYEWEDAGAAVLAGNSSAEKFASGRGGSVGEAKGDSAGEAHGGNDSVVPPGFEGIGIKREASLQN